MKLLRDHTVTMKSDADDAADAIVLYWESDDSTVGTMHDRARQIGASLLVLMGPIWTRLLTGSPRDPSVPVFWKVNTSDLFSACHEEFDPERLSTESVTRILQDFLKRDRTFPPGSWPPDEGSPTPSMAPSSVVLFYKAIEPFCGYPVWFVTTPNSDWLLSPPNNDEPSVEEPPLFVLQGVKMDGSLDPGRPLSKFAQWQLSYRGGVEFLVSWTVYAASKPRLVLRSSRDRRERLGEHSGLEVSVPFEFDDREGPLQECITRLLRQLIPAAEVTTVELSPADYSWRYNPVTNAVSSPELPGYVFYRGLDAAAQEHFQNYWFYAPGAEIPEQVASDHFGTLLAAASAAQRDIAREKSKS